MRTWLLVSFELPFGRDRFRRRCRFGVTTENGSSFGLGPNGDEKLAAFGPGTARRADVGTESGSFEKPQPSGAGKHAFDVAVAHHPRFAVPLAKGVDEVAEVRRVGGIGVPRPLEVAKRA